MSAMKATSPCLKLVNTPTIGLVKSNQLINQTLGTLFRHYAQIQNC